MRLQCKVQQGHGLYHSLPTFLHLWLVFVAATLAVAALPLTFADEHPEGVAQELPASYHDLGYEVWQSDELGVARCSLQGVLGEEDVTLHIWMRAAPPSVASRTLCADQPDNATCLRTALVRGFALLQSNRRSIPVGGPVGLQLLQAGSIDLFSKEIFLRSGVTKTHYHLTTRLVNNSHYLPWDPTHPIEGWTNHVMDIEGAVLLNREDMGQADFEIRATGFDWHCPFWIRPPVLGYKKPGGVRIEKDGQVLAWQHHQASSLGEGTQVWQVLSPFHRVKVHDYATMLWHRVLWHTQLGVTHYLLYVYESLSPLLREPLIQELISQGTLHVVLYTELPKHERRPMRPTATDLYTMQVLAYNHALLALWGSDILVLVADVDEYLITPKPMSVVQAFKECRNTTSPGLPSAGLQVRRTDAVCSPHVGPELCTHAVPNLASWTNVSLADVRAGRAPHPLSWHAMTSAEDLWGHHNTKPLVDPNLARDVHVHFFKGAVNASANVSSRDYSRPDCMRLLHLSDLYKVRRTFNGSMAPVDSVVGGNSSWWWPVARMQQQQHEQRRKA